MIEVAGLRKSYGETIAVAGVSFEARPGEVFGLLGPNGAGKSTAIGCLSGVIQPTSGRIRVQGFDIVSQARDAKRALGTVPQDIALYEDLSATENLRYWGGVQGLRGAGLAGRVRQLLELTGLTDRAREPIKRYSGGMKRRLNFACGVVHAPKVVLLDEPTVGVDPQSRVRLLELVRGLVHEGACVLYTTHYMEEAESLCDRLAIIDHGRIIAEGTLAGLRSMLNERDLLRLTGTFVEQEVREALRDQPGLEVIAVDSSQLTLSVLRASERLAELFARLSAAGAGVRGATLTQPSLESLFIKLTGKELRE